MKKARESASCRLETAVFLRIEDQLPIRDAVLVHSSRVRGLKVPVHAAHRRAAKAVAFSILLATVLALFVGVLPAAGAAPNSTYLRAEYDVDATINWSQGSIDVVSTAHVTNTSSESIHGLTFNLLPLAIGRASRIETTIGGTPVVPRISGMSLIVDFSGPLAPKLSTAVIISYRAVFNTNTGGKKALFMKKNNTV